MPKHTLRFHDLAREEVRGAYQYYESKKPGLGDEFLEEIDKVIQLTLDNPEIYPIEFGEAPEGSCKKISLYHYLHHPRSNHLHYLRF